MSNSPPSRLQARHDADGYVISYRPSRWDGLFQVVFSVFWLLSVSSVLVGALNEILARPVPVVVVTFGSVGLIFLVAGLSGFLQGAEKLLSTRTLRVDPLRVRYETWPVRFRFPRTIGRDQIQSFAIVKRSRRIRRRNRISYQVQVVLTNGKVLKALDLGRDALAARLALEALRSQGLTVSER